jgi:hypothetical protein
LYALEFNLGGIMVDTILYAFDDEKGDALAKSHSILSRWGDDFCHLLNVRGVNNARQTEI